MLSSDFNFNSILLNLIKLRNTLNIYLLYKRYKMMLFNITLKLAGNE